MVSVEVDPGKCYELGYSLCSVDEALMSNSFGTKITKKLFCSDNGGFGLFVVLTS